MRARSRVRGGVSARAQAVCDKHDPEYYAKFKQWADEYFAIKHRGETRGLGGIFFDDQNDRAPDDIFAFSKECLDSVRARGVKRDGACAAHATWDCNGEPPTDRHRAPRNCRWLCVTRVGR